ncbi:MAG: adenosylmethionine--8-amino-7-oxononanoate aminotransferase BioA, partial [Chlamydiae bacterium]
SAAVEVALKMSYQYWKLSGKPEKKRFVSISGAYHGETLGALSVGGIELYRETFSPIMLDTFNVEGPNCFRCPYGKTRDNCSAECFADMERTLTNHSEEIAAVFIEPLVQCANNMNIYSPVYLKKLRELTAELNIHLVADEIAVGFGRTGKMFACEHADVVPDFICMSKGLTGGYMPFAATLVYDEKIYDAFYGEYTEYKAFYHSHSYTGNPMAAGIGLEVIPILENEVMPNLPEKIKVLSEILAELAELPNAGEIRQCGFIGALELVADKKTNEPFPAEKRIGWQVYREALKRGALLRPLGDVIYFLTPLTISIETLKELGRIAKESIQKVIKL